MQALIRNIEETETYDREIALIDLYIYLVSESAVLPNKNNTCLFVELSEWRDCSLRDGVESYYEDVPDEKLTQLKTSMEIYQEQTIVKQFASGFQIYKKNDDFSELDIWIFENEWKINDFLAQLAYEK